MMRTIIIFFVLSIFLSCNSQVSKNEKHNNNIDSLGIKIDDCKNYIGKEIKLFLKDSNFSEYNRILIIDSKPGKASSIMLEYDENIEIELFPTEFKHMNSFDPKAKWDIEKFKLETIEKIKIYKKGRVIEEFR